MIELDKIDWKQTEDGKWLAYENSTQLTGWVRDLERDAWYYCCSDDIQTGWFKDVDGRWYYLSPCQQVTYNHQYYKGEMMTNWIEVDGKWYYLLPKSIPSEGIYRGQMLSNISRNINGIDYSFNTDGSLIECSDGVSDKGIDFIKSYEGYFAEPYYDCVGVKTLGYGMTGREIQGLSYVTEPQATQMLRDLVNKKYYPPIKKVLDDKGISLSQNEIDALVSMAYNVGYAGLLSSTLFKNVCNGVRNADTIMSNFCAWSKAGGRTLTGLLRRRKAEANIFLYDKYVNN